MILPPTSLTNWGSKISDHFWPFLTGQAAYPDPTTLFPNIVVCGERFSGEMVEDGDADPSSKGRPSSKSNQSQRTVPGMCSHVFGKEDLVHPEKWPLNSEISSNPWELEVAYFQANPYLIRFDTWKSAFLWKTVRACTPITCMTPSPSLTTIWLLDPMDVITPLAMNRRTTCTKIMFPLLSPFERFLHWGSLSAFRVRTNTERSSSRDLGGSRSWRVCSKVDEHRSGLPCWCEVERPSHSQEMSRVIRCN